VLMPADVFCAKARC